MEMRIATKEAEKAAGCFIVVRSKSIGSFHNPTLGEIYETLGLIWPPDDLGLEIRQEFSETLGEKRSLIGAVGMRRSPIRA